MLSPEGKINKNSQHKNGTNSAYLLLRCGYMMTDLPLPLPSENKSSSSFLRHEADTRPADVRTNPDGQLDG